MKVIARYVCKVTRIYLSDEISLSIFKVCPIDFWTTNRRPDIGDVSFEIRPSDTVDEEGLALIQHGLFVGWISKSQEKNILHRLLSTGTMLTGFIQTRDSFNWHSGGGTCYRGSVQVESLDKEANSRGQDGDKTGSFEELQEEDKIDDVGGTADKILVTTK